MSKKINITEEQAVKLYKETRDKKLRKAIREFYLIKRKDLESKISGNLIQAAIHWILIAYNYKTIYDENLEIYWRGELATFLLNSTKFDIKGGNLANAVESIVARLRLSDYNVISDLFIKKLNTEIKNNGNIYLDENAANESITLFCSKENFSEFVKCLTDSAKEIGKEYAQEEIISDYVASLPPNF